MGVGRSSDGASRVLGVLGLRKFGAKLPGLEGFRVARVFRKPELNPLQTPKTLNSKAYTP